MNQITRRGFVRTSGALAAALAAPAALETPLAASQAAARASAGNAPKFRLGIVTYMIAADWDVPTILRVCKNVGISDVELIDALYEASQAGVDIDLIVRGLCLLRPGVPDLSERIRVTSLVGRFLEHARIYHFGNGGDDEYLIGSADWRARNVRRRIEVVAPIVDPACRRRLEQILERELNDGSAWILRSDGGYERAESVPTPGSEAQLLGLAETALAREAVAP